MSLYFNFVVLDFDKWVLMAVGFCYDKEDGEGFLDWEKDEEGGGGVVVVADRGVDTIYGRRNYGWRLERSESFGTVGSFGAVSLGGVEVS